MTAPLVLVDAENVRRSTWPNLTRDELVEACRAWGERERRRVEIVFDGRAPQVGTEPGLAVIGSGTESADDLLVRRAEELRTAGEAFWLITSDRALRQVAGVGAEQVVGGGSFVRELQR